MNRKTPTNYRHQILFAVVLLLLGQFVSSLHNHEITQPNLDTDDCIICLIGNAGADASPIAPRLSSPNFSLNFFYAVANNAATRTNFPITNHSRAPPNFS